MSFYVDASIIVAIVAKEPTRNIVEVMLTDHSAVPIISDLCHSEASAALTRLRRIGRVDDDLLNQMLHRLDDWALAVGDRQRIASGDIEAATTFVRRLDIVLRTPDAIHIAAAHRLGATLLTLDRGMARAAAALGVNYLNPAEAEAPGEPKD